MVTGRTRGLLRKKAPATPGHFQRTLSLPMGIESDKVEANLKDGVLTLVLPKREEYKSRQIAVKSR